MFEDVSLVNVILVFKHGDDDYELYFPEIFSHDNDLWKLLEKYENTGCSIRGNREDIEFEFTQISLD